MQIIHDPKLDFKDVLFVPKVNNIQSRAEVHLRREFEYIDMAGNVRSFRTIPIIASNMDGVGTFSMARALGDMFCMTAITKHESDEDWSNFMQQNSDVGAIYSIGMGKYSNRNALLQQTANIIEKLQIQFLCIDVANGYNYEFVEYVAKARELMPLGTFIMAGNVVTPGQTEALIHAGANAVKVGIGSGSVCTTRKVTGVGYPQLSAVIECADAAHGLNGYLISDGGCQTPADVAKAFGAGADFVMLGGMLAGHKESELPISYKGDVEIVDNQTYKLSEAYIKFHGSSSKSAQELHNGELAEYRSSEGKCVDIPYRGEVSVTLQHILGGLRSTCSYIGARKIEDMPKCTTFIKVQNGHQYNTVFGDSDKIT